MGIYVITRLCRDRVDTKCVSVCPVNCIYEYTGADRERFPNQLYINPDECIECNLCEVACPWQAIYEVDAVPAELRDDIQLNAAMLEDEAAFKGAEVVDKPQPTRAQVASNKEQWSVADSAWRDID